MVWPCLLIRDLRQLGEKALTMLANQLAIVVNIIYPWIGVQGRKLDLLENCVSISAPVKPAFVGTYRLASGQSFRAKTMDIAHGGSSQFA